MLNQTIITQFIFSGLSDLPGLQLLLFILFLLIYIVIIVCNLLIIFLVITNSHLHTPMYFFLGNLASLDVCCSSVTFPPMLLDPYNQNVVSIRACMTQIFFFLHFASCEVFLLAAMSYDRYVAICHPLHYMQIMDRRVCVQIISGVWSLGFIQSLVHTLYASKLVVCRSNIIKSFFCDLPQLFQISCSDATINILLIFFLGGFLAFGTLVLTFLPYVSILKNVLKMQVKGKRSKLFSTCSSHLSVVFLFYGSIIFNYLGPSASNRFSGNIVLTIFYAALTPLFNPLIYSIRNQEFKSALRNVATKIFSSTKKQVRNLSF